jgi:hypothetical protein
MKFYKLINLLDVVQIIRDKDDEVEDVFAFSAIGTLLSCAGRAATMVIRDRSNANSTVLKAHSKIITAQFLPFASLR